MRRLRFLWLLPLWGVLLVSFAQPPTATSAQIAFAKQMEQRDHYPAKKILHWLQVSAPNEHVTKLLDHPYEQQPWTVYRSHFLNSNKINLGLKYWLKHHRALHEAELKYGVDPAIIVAIIGIESNFGSHQRAYNTLRTLNTLSFYHEHRHKFFTKELRELFLLARDLKITPDKIMGSYAGALGIPQFMPSSYRYYAVAHGKHFPDLFAKHDDAIFSIANYLKKSGWQAKQPIAVAVSKRKSAADKGEYITLDNKTSEQLWRIYPNFHAILHYNNSKRYAMAATLLAKTLRTKYER